MQPAQNPGDFDFRELAIDEKPRKPEIEVPQEVKDFIEELPDKERLQLWQNLKSKNRAAQKRAKRKIASASKSRNRR